MLPREQILPVGRECIDSIGPLIHEMMSLSKSCFVCVTYIVASHLYLVHNEGISNCRTSSAACTMFVSLAISTSLTLHSV